MVSRHRPPLRDAASGAEREPRATSDGAVADVRPPDVHPPDVRQVQLVGRRIRRLRKDHRLSVPELAAAVGLPLGDLARLEKGEYRVSLDVLFKLLAVLATSVEQFFADVARELAQAPEPEGVREL
jgi:DNA-binding XRE family transcriptional regulator